MRHIKRISLHLFEAALVLSLSAAAQAASPLPAEAAECASIDDNTARLACYDGYNPPLKTRRAQPAAARAGTELREEAASAKSDSPVQLATANGSSARSEPGLDEQQQRQSERKPTRQALVARVASISRRNDGGLLLRLDNGQSWLQLEQRGGASLVPGDTVSITPAMMGSYLLRSDSGVSSRVRRLN